MRCIQAGNGSISITSSNALWQSVKGQVPDSEAPDSCQKGSNKKQATLISNELQGLLKCGKDGLPCMICPRADDPESWRLWGSAPALQQHKCHASGRHAARQAQAQHNREQSRSVGDPTVHMPCSLFTGLLVY